MSNVRLTRQISSSWETVQIPWTIAFPPSHSTSRCFSSTVLHMPLEFIRLSSLRLTYLSHSVNPSLTHFFLERDSFQLGPNSDIRGYAISDARGRHRHAKFKIEIRQSYYQIV